MKTVFAQTKEGAESGWPKAEILTAFEKLEYGLVRSLILLPQRRLCDPKCLYLESNLNNSYILYLRRNLSTRPAVSIIFCFPV
jgi:hypothetical protein